MQHEDLSALSTPHLIRLAVAEAKLLVRAEVLHAKAEMKEELTAAKSAGIFLGAGGALSICGLTLLFVALAWVLPISAALGALTIGGVLLLAAGGLVYAGTRGLPRKPLPRTQHRLKEDLQLTKEQLT
ncbi:MAG: phage holin family protein [Myxococcaceae bacterium]